MVRSLWLVGTIAGVLLLSEIRAKTMRHSTPFVWKRGRASLNRRLIALYRNHGISEALFIEWIEQMFPIGSVKHRLLVARAYDNAHRTQTHLALPNILDVPDFTRVE